MKSKNLKKGFISIKESFDNLTQSAPSLIQIRLKHNKHTQKNFHVRKFEEKVFKM